MLSSFPSFIVTKPKNKTKQQLSDCNLNVPVRSKLEQKESLGRRRWVGIQCYEFSTFRSMAEWGREQRTEIQFNRILFLFELKLFLARCEMSMKKN